ncbi:MAG: MFS transporter [Frankiales bacterium]|nr:MFS transporter [Frankiales bacterium]
MVTDGLSRDAKRVLVGTCFNAVGNGFVLPFTIIYLHEVRHISLASAGLMFSAAALVGVLVVPIIGTLVDRLGARPVLYATLVLSTAGSLGLATARTPALALVSMLVLGAGNGGSWPASQAFIAALVPAERRSRFFALGFAVLNLGIGLGGLAAAIIVRPGHPGTYELLFVADAVTFVIDGVLLLPVRPRGVGRPEAEPDAPQGSYRLLLSDRVLRRLFTMQFVLVLVGYAQVEAGFPAYLRELGVSPRVVGIGFTFNTLTIVLGQLTVQRRSARVRRTRSLVVVASLWAASWVVLASAWWLPAGARPAVAIVYSIIFAAGEMFFAPTIPSLVNDIAPERLRGRANAASSLCWTGASVVGPVLAGAMIGAGASIAWLVVLIAGCAGAALLALHLERIVPADANLPPEPDDGLQIVLPETTARV